MTEIHFEHAGWKRRSEEKVRQVEQWRERGNFRETLRSPLNNIVRELVGTFHTQ